MIRQKTFSEILELRFVTNKKLIFLKILESIFYRLKEFNENKISTLHVINVIGAYTISVASLGAYSKPLSNYIPNIPLQFLLEIKLKCKK